MAHCVITHCSPSHPPTRPSHPSLPSFPFFSIIGATGAMADAAEVKEVKEEAEQAEAELSEEDRALKEALEMKRVCSGSTVLLCGFGVGLSWGTALIRIP